jgi:hypothetical protein
VREIDFWVGPPPTANVWNAMGFFKQALLA